MNASRTIRPSTGFATMSPVRRGLLGLAGGCLVLVLVAWGTSRGGSSATHAVSRLSATPPAGFEPVADIAGVQPPPPVSLDSGWLYLADPGNVGLRRDWAHGGALSRHWSSVSVPNDFNPVVNRAGYAGSDGWYKVHFTAPPSSPARTWAVRFSEVRRHADVWLNGLQIGSSTDNFAPFSLPATGLRPGRGNLLVVRVDSRRSPASFPQDWWNWGGITQPVQLVPVGRVAVQDLGAMPELGCGYRCADLLVQGTVRNLGSVPERAQFTVNLRAPGGAAWSLSHAGPLVAAQASVPVSFRVPVRGPVRLWAPGHPSLYSLQIATRVQGRVEQSDSMRVGLRSIQVRGGILYLNGQRLWLHGASIHEDVKGRGAALSGQDIDTIVSELKSVGANITRAHYLLSDRLLRALDAAGILVWSQPPVDHADPLLRTASGRSQALALLRTTIIGARSHPSVVINSVGNELSPTPDTTPGTRLYMESAMPLARRLDPGAAVAVDTYCYPGFPAQQVYQGADVIGISDYFGWYQGRPGHSISDFAGLEPFLNTMRARYPKQALVIAEFGAEGLYDGPVTSKGSYAFQADYLRKTFGILDQLPFMNGAIYWTMREFAVNPGWVGGAVLPPGDQPDGLHHKGLITYAGVEKPAFGVAQQMFAQTPPYLH